MTKYSAFWMTEWVGGNNLLAKCDKKQVCDKFIKKYGDIPTDKYSAAYDKLSSFIDKLLCKKACDNDNDILISYTAYDGLDNTKFLDTSVYSIKDIKEFFRPLPYFDELDDQNIETLSDEQVTVLWKKHCELLDKRDAKHPEKSYPGIIQGKAYDLCDWSDILGFLVPDHISETGDGAIFAAAVLNEISFFGFEEEDMINERKKIEEAIEEYEKIKDLPEEEQKKHFVSMEEIDEYCKSTGADEENIRYDESKVRRSMLLTQISIYRSLKKVYAEL